MLTKIERLLRLIPDLIKYKAQMEYYEKRLKETAEEINELKAGLTEEELGAIDILHSVISRDYSEIKRNET